MTNLFFKMARVENLNTTQLKGLRIILSISRVNQLYFPKQINLQNRKKESQMSSIKQSKSKSRSFKIIF